jgi:hypothetical protein
MTFTQEPSHERDVTRFDAILITGLIAITRGGFDGPMADPSLKCSGSGLGVSTAVEN